MEKLDSSKKKQSAGGRASGPKGPKAKTPPQPNLSPQRPPAITHAAPPLPRRPPPRKVAGDDDLDAAPKKAAAPVTVETGDVSEHPIVKDETQLLDRVMAHLS